MQSASGIAAAVCGGAVRAADVLAEARRRHDATHARLNALVQPRFDAAREEAALVTPGSPLAGVPVSVKDCFPVRGLSTTLGIVARRGLRDTADAALVARLRCLGALVVGTANVPQAMLLHETDNPVWGRTNHPLDPGRGPGGSSGGDAALVAAGVVPLAIGNDLAGSLRQPAHACGIAALMPRSTALGEGGAVDTVPHLEVVRPRAGFLAAHVADLRLALHAVVRGAPPSAAAGPSAGMRIGWWDDGGPVPASAAVVRAVGEAVGSLSRAGSEMVRLDGGIAGEAAWLHLAILAADGGSDIRALFGGEQPIAGVARLLGLAGLPRGLRPVLAAVARLTGRRIEAEALGRTGPRDAAGLGRLLEARAALARRFETLVAGLDAVVCPVSALPALRHGTAAQLVVAAAPCLLANLLDLPAGAVPVTEVRPGEEATRPRSRDPVLRAAAECDRGCAGLPVGVQVVACPGRDEDAVLDVMAAVEAARQPPSRATIARGI